MKYNSKHINYFAILKSLSAETERAMMWMHNYGNQERDMDGSFVFSLKKYIDNQYHSHYPNIEHIPMTRIEVGWGPVKAQLFQKLCDYSLKFKPNPTGFTVQAMFMGELLPHSTKKIDNCIAYIWGLKYAKYHHDQYINPEELKYLLDADRSLSALQNIDCFFNNYIDSTYKHFVRGVVDFDEIKALQND